MSKHITKTEAESLIKQADFYNLFIKLGWDTSGLPPDPLELQIDDQPFSIDRVVHKRGFAVCVCNTGDQPPPTGAVLKKLINKLAPHHFEHLLIFHGAGRQSWNVAIRPQNRPMRNVGVMWHENQDIQPLMEKLHGIIFDIAEEDTLGITDVVEKVRHAFMENSEAVTKKFYREFQSRLDAFSSFIDGITDQVSKEWYAALMLNRLMFIYFIQKKNFLDGDIYYLENRLEQTKEQYGKDAFHTQFYSHFLRRLFAKGLGTPHAERDAALKKLLGKVPYLNGGLFDLHAIEKQNNDIKIPDRAFEELFDFFNQYEWHLDSRPIASGKDINPDVIGYIFEKYINERAKMGAYYTQEDVTGYISRNTIIPFLLNRAREKCKNAFDRDNGIWRFLRDNPDNYIYEAVKHGCDIPDSKIPENIRCGLDVDAPDLITRRADWNTPADARFALPTEIWRETIARRARYAALKKKMKVGEICTIDDLITYNLDIERFAAAALAAYEGSDFIAAFYEAIAGRKSLKSNQQEKRGVTVLDPACGSGAFLFSALNILEPLYAKCVHRMREFVEQDNQAQKNGKDGKKHPQFRAVLTDIAEHQNERYWIYKTIILNNLYGVDLMKEAAEIAKLRLFLKLAAEAEYKPDDENLGLAPLPDIDFNIRAGNSLVGFASMAQVKKSLAPDKGQQSLDMSDGLINEISEDARLVQKTYDRFIYAQDHGGEDYRTAKTDLSKCLAELNDKLNKYLAVDYGANKKQSAGEYAAWLKDHRPFHWLAEFYGIIESDGGFDVVIGNPPYVEYSKVKKTYTVKNYETESCGNLYAYFIELGTKLTNKFNSLGMIVPISIVSTPRTKTVRDLIEFQRVSIHTSNFADRPGALFNGVHQKVSIVITHKNKQPAIHTTNFLHWSGRTERTGLFGRINYIISQPDKDGIYPKAGFAIEQKILAKVNSNKQGLLSLMTHKNLGNKPLQSKYAFDVLG